MLIQKFLIAAVAGVEAAPKPRTVNSPQIARAVVDATYDGRCFYPKPAEGFELNRYLGRWYQVAGTPAPFTEGCKCIHADYSLNANGTVDVVNGCERTGRASQIEGTATLVSQSAGYGEAGVLRVQFPGRPAPRCPGPNYIVQDIGLADGSEYDEVGAASGEAFAIVQTSNFSTLFVLSRQQKPDNASIEAWLLRAARLGSNLTDVSITDQSGCQAA